jgi:hypothetical protein
MAGHVDVPGGELAFGALHRSQSMSHGRLHRLASFFLQRQQRGAGSVRTIIGSSEWRAVVSGRGASVLSFIPYRPRGHMARHPNHAAA